MAVVRGSTAGVSIATTGENNDRIDGRAGEISEKIAETTAATMAAVGWMIGARAGGIVSVGVIGVISQQSAANCNKQTLTLVI